MPSSSTRSRTRIPLFRSFSANAANDHDRHEHDHSRDGHSPNNDAPDRDDSPQTDTPRSSLGALGFSLPTLSTLANLNIRRRGRSKSNAKRTSLDSRWRKRGQQDLHQQQTPRDQHQDLPGLEGPRGPSSGETERLAKNKPLATKHHGLSNRTATTCPGPPPEGPADATATDPECPAVPGTSSGAIAAASTTRRASADAGVGAGATPPAAAVETRAHLAAPPPPFETAVTTGTPPAAAAAATSPLSSSSHFALTLPLPACLSPAPAHTHTQAQAQAQATSLAATTQALASGSSITTTDSTTSSSTPAATPTSTSSPLTNTPGSISACASAHSNPTSGIPDLKHHPTPITRHPAPTPEGIPQDPTISSITTNTTTINPQPPPPPRLAVQRPSTPSVPTLSNPDIDSHESLPTMQRKIWVKRPGASPTRVEVAGDDLVDNVRDVILRKYANSLGRSIDSPDITLKIVSREPGNKNVNNERALGPEESIGQTLDAYYPGGQTVDEALLIEVASRRTPRASPRAGNHQISYFYPDQYRPDDAAREYFPPMPAHSPHLAHVQHQAAMPHAMSVLTTGQLPPLPSPGSHGTRRHGSRPVYRRQHTSSPTILHTVQPNGQVIETKSQLSGPMPSAPPLPTPPAQPNEQNSTITPPNRVGSPHLGQKPKKKKNVARSANGDPAPNLKPASASLLDGSVPPINVLLVEDNVINLRLLEAFMKRLKVRWQSAVNGKEAVSMWRTGGFHLVLMDIQLPVMNGLDATKEIRRLEAVNGIGVFSGSPIENGLKMASKSSGPVSEEDNLPDRSLFKSPVIIVALTASSLQSDRHEALAAGCNDFLTKPVNFVWMERKVTEWGCMQALIDFDGWRKWKQYADEKAKEDPAKKAAEEKEEKAKAKAALKAFMARSPPSAKKESNVTSPSSATTERASTPVQNGTAKKSFANEDRRPRSHKSSRSTTSVTTTGGNLESMAEVDEKGV